MSLEIVVAGRREEERRLEEQRAEREEVERDMTDDTFMLVSSLKLRVQYLTVCRSNENY